ncbi:carboxylating nicotinate-nucleotide diphosphorylase [Halomarina halobia]|uniref:Nicotinate-nucleotide pyrophosphorylase [carboxylating] n=1 Tax=Halomarina halobia TaxID=3033386 RepID=A0ABD6A8C9_9EURY|nr:carboxylating nicotinate-nucleotide diphosphorylase [Halomarina sp. PSR21]
MLTDTQVESWLVEDVGHHDATDDVPGEARGLLVAREAGVAAGLDAARAVFDYLGVDAEPQVEEGDRVGAGDAVLAVEGPARDVLRGERAAVNVAAHASGIATRTREAVDAARAASAAVRIACTRKTTPGLRGVEKRAVAAGGGDTHRLDLSHAAMVKDNHVAALGLERAVERVRDRVSFATTVIAEVERPADGPRAAAAGADAVLFDNLPPAAVERGVERLPAGVLAEASGGIALADVPAYAATGVDVISMGSLTHSAPALDYSFRVECTAERDG